MSGPIYTAKEMLARLVAFDTTSSKSNLPLIDFVEDYLDQHGIESERTPTPEGDKASLFATIGPSTAGGVAFSGHTDVVPVDGQAWDSDPFTLVERGGRLYGRGTCDMKGYLACVLAAVPDFKTRKLKVPLHIAFSYDEEVGCVGVRPMIGRLGKTLPLPRMVVVGEPSGMTVVDAHKGPMRWRVDVTGRPAHSSMAHLGVNAITYASRIIGEIDRLEQDLKALPPNPRFAPPWSTVQTTQIEGGTASNIVPLPCWFGWEVRALPGLDPLTLDKRVRAFAIETCLPEMRQVAPEANITMDITGSVPPFAADTASGIIPWALKIAEQNETFAVSYATEAGLFQDGGAPAIICGPGDIAQAHTPNEFVEASELDKCMLLLGRIGDWCSA